MITHGGLHGHPFDKVDTGIPAREWCRRALGERQLLAARPRPEQEPSPKLLISSGN
jgi:hypothetical protein